MYYIYYMRFSLHTCNLIFRLFHPRVVPFHSHFFLIVDQHMFKTKHTQPTMMALTSPAKELISHSRNWPRKHPQTGPTTIGGQESKTAANAKEAGWMCWTFLGKTTGVDRLWWNGMTAYGVGLLDQMKYGLYIYNNHSIVIKWIQTSDSYWLFVHHYYHYGKTWL